ncbi:FkbM family methyltransferase [Brachyspira alvinipulli]|uniref:FkbM family methyltransferase n=1 Tax=Brachyspira alvinipulli TaxID=84379 RepID=UPI0030053A5A
MFDKNIYDKYKIEEIDKLVDSYRNVFNNIENDYNAGISIYGIGFVGSYAIDYLSSLNIKINYLIDRDKNKIGTKINGIEVISPDDSLNKNINSILISARHAVKPVMEFYKDKLNNLMSFDAYYIIKNYDKIKNISTNEYQDLKSSIAYNGVLYSMITGDKNHCLEVMEKDMYFCLPEFSGNFEEIFIDAGAFVGDTVEKFIIENMGTFKHLYAFEPGDKQFEAMSIRMERLKKEYAIKDDTVTLVKAGLGKKTSKMSTIYLDDSPIRHTLSNDNSNNCNVDVFSLDEFLNGKEVTFIKVDIEGMEYDFLEGAKETIKKYKPKIAICIYHYPCDLHRIFEYIKKIDSTYKFKFRHHAPLIGDFVLYCYH